MCRYEMISENPESTVVAEYQPSDTPRSTAYQSEAELEKAFIELLQSQAYEYLPITTEACASPLGWTTFIKRLV